MIFVGYDFCSDGDSMKSCPVPPNYVNKMELRNGVYDDLYVTKDTSTQIIPDQWTYNTILHALFNGTLNGGNLNYTIEQVSALRVKRRKKPKTKEWTVDSSHEYDWITLFEVPINYYEDFQFTRYDLYASGNQIYEYAIVPVLGNVEGAMTVDSVESKFGGVVVVNNESAYHTIADVVLNTHTRQFSVAVLRPLNQQYPYIINNGDSNYDTGTCSAFFNDVDYISCKINLDDQVAHLNDFINFLTDGTPKFLKTGDGRAWIISVTGNPTASNSQHKNKWITNFDWTEIGDKNSSTDMFNAGFIDKNVEGS